MSRPSSSVPIQCTALGEASRAGKILRGGVGGREPRRGEGDDRKQYCEREAATPGRAVPEEIAQAFTNPLIAAAPADQPAHTPCP